MGGFRSVQNVSWSILGKISEITIRQFGVSALKVFSKFMIMFHTCLLELGLRN